MARHLGPLGELEAEEVTGKVVNERLRALLESGLSRSTVRGAALTVCGALRDADMPLRGVRVPARGRRTGRKGTWTAAQASTFLAEALRDRLAAGWALAVVGGMRRGELAGLTWDAVDLDEGVVNVREQRTLVNGRPGVLVCEPKGTSARLLPIGPGIAGLLAERRRGWEAERARSRGRWCGGAHVLAHVNGEPYHPSYFTHRWAALCRAAGVPVIALHDARHTSASLAAASGVDLKTLQARLGHADAKILTQVYLHLVTEAGRGAASVVEQAIWPQALRGW